MKTTTKLIAVICSIAIIFAGYIFYTHTFALTEDSVSIPNTEYPQTTIVTINQPTDAVSATGTPLVAAAIKKTEPAPIVSTGPVPQTLLIPSLSINAKIERVGINAKGNMAVPKVFKNIGWYGGGTFPGKSGNAIMDGHVNNGRGLLGVFADLKNINQGDDIFVKISDGNQLQFKVTKTILYEATDSASEVFMSADGKPRLVLITCDGIWIPETKTYTQRFVVFADLVE